MIKRLLFDRLLHYKDFNKIKIILGARQVGKTTLLRQLEQQFGQHALWINGDEPHVRQEFENINSNELKQLIGTQKLLFFDEAQRIPNIGLTLKLLYDNFPDLEVYVTGSSAFYLADTIKESLAGRKLQFNLYSLSFEEITEHYGLLHAKSTLDTMLVYGLYPEVYTRPEYAKDILNELIDSYLFKDVFQFSGIKRHELIDKLTQALSFQIGSQVSYTEISSLVGTTKDTVNKYINLLEQNFIVFRLSSFSTNQRNELKKSKKIYFWDIGIRNAIINDFRNVNLRQDIGHLWENFLIVERLKTVSYKGIDAKPYFWRSTTGLEIDYLEIRSGEIYAYEFKWNENRKVKQPRAFLSLYPQAHFTVISKSNFLEFVQADL